MKFYNMSSFYILVIHMESTINIASTLIFYECHRTQSENRSLLEKSVIQRTDTRNIHKHHSAVLIHRYSDTLSGQMSGTNPQPVHVCVWQLLSIVTTLSFFY